MTKHSAQCARGANVDTMRKINLKTYLMIICKPLLFNFEMKHLSLGCLLFVAHYKD